jgi:predicted aspartyl protease
VATVVGSIDERRRPLIRIGLVGGGDSFLAMLDTGFNGEMLVSVHDIEALGFQTWPGYSEHELASGAVAGFQRGLGHIFWMGRLRRVDVYVSMEARRARRDGDPIALVGTRLLSPNLVLLDFEGLSIEIES